MDTHSKNLEAALPYLKHKFAHGNTHSPMMNDFPHKGSIADYGSGDYLNHMYSIDWISNMVDSDVRPMWLLPHVIDKEQHSEEGLNLYGPRKYDSFEDVHEYSQEDCGQIETSEKDNYSLYATEANQAVKCSEIKPLCVSNPSKQHFSTELHLLDFI